MAERLYRREYHLYGRVQEVGLRYTAGRLAKACGMTGWVRNEDDGSVTLTLQACSAADFVYFLRALTKGTWIRIDHADYDSVPPVIGERSFRVEYY